jgi:hypothetical protein
MKDEKIVAETLIKAAVASIDNEKTKRCVTNGLSCVSK